MNSLKPVHAASVALLLACLGATEIADAEEAAPSGESATTTPTATSTDPKEKAQALFMAGMEAFDQEKYVDALEHFRESHAQVKSPNSRLMAARSLRQLGRMPEAYHEYDMALLEAEAAAAEDEKYIETVQAVRDELRDVRSQVAIVMIVLEGDPPEGTRLTVAGREIDRANWKRAVPASPGTIRVVLEGAGIERREQVLDLNGGAEGEVEFDVVFTGAAGAAARAAEERAQLRTTSFIAGGVGGVGLLTFGIVALADGNDALKYGALGVGIAGVATGVVLFTLSLPSDSGSSDTARASLVVGPTSARVIGTF